MPQTRTLESQRLIFSQFWQARGQGPGVGSWGRLSSWVLVTSFPWHTPQTLLRSETQSSLLPFMGTPALLGQDPTLRPHFTSATSLEAWVSNTCTGGLGVRCVDFGETQFHPRCLNKRITHYLSAGNCHISTYCPQGSPRCSLGQVPSSLRQGGVPLMDRAIHRAPQTRHLSVDPAVFLPVGDFEPCCQGPGAPKYQLKSLPSALLHAPEAELLNHRRF